MTRTSRLVFACACLSFSPVVAGVARADVKLPNVFGSHMVLQEGKPLPFWGTADPGESITIEALGKKVVGTAGPDGKWKAQLPALSAEGAFTVTVRGKNTITFDDVLLGDVWVASGQSNMQFPLFKATNGSVEVAQANYPRIRLFNVKQPAPPFDATDVQASWAACTPESAEKTTAVGYFFAREIHTQTGRPIGIIHSNWGGTPVETWTSISALAEIAPLRKRIAPYQKPPAGLAAEIEKYQAALAQWEISSRHEDPPNRGEAQGFARRGVGMDGWKPMTVPGDWESQGLAIDGAVWFRKDVAVLPAWIGKDLLLGLGRVNDCDTTYVEGQQIGHSCRDTPDQFGKPRLYTIPGRLVQRGRMLIAVRVFDEHRAGGIVGAAEEISLKPADAQGPVVSLAGRWNARVETELPQLQINEDTRPVPPAGMRHFQAPSVLWETMIRPLIPFAIRGVIWYQGESNAGMANLYHRTFATMIGDWRKAWGQGAFPFYFAQLASFHPTGWSPGRKPEDEWAELREAQFTTLRKVTETGMAVITDVGDRNDIHPRNKQDVGKRLALWALAMLHGKKIAYSGPLYKDYKLEKDTVRVRFEHAEGLRADGFALMGFEVAGLDKRWFPAKAVIEDDTVVVSVRYVKKPVAVRYAWSDDPVGNLRNGAGLPASPFRSDSWLRITDGRE